MASREIAIVIDCRMPDRLLEFWAEALGYVKADWPHEPYRVLVPEDGDGPTVILQRVREAKAGKNRLHIDIYCEDAEAEAERLEAIGAQRRTELVEEHGSTWIVMQDPEGNEFCVVVPVTGS